MGATDLPTSTRRRGLIGVAAAAVLATAVPGRGAAAADWSQSWPVTVTTEDYAFDPSSLTFKAGGIYRLHVENRGKELHEFAAPDFFRAIRMRNPQALNADRTEIAVPPGQSKDLYFIARTPGSFPLICPDHDWAGMVGRITIEP